MSLTIKLGNTSVDLGNTKLSFVLTSPYPLMASGQQGGNYVFNFSVPATPELKLEFKHAHRPQSKSSNVSLPFLIDASGLKFSGTASISEADDETYEVFCPVKNGDFNALAKEINLTDLNYGGSLGDIQPEICHAVKTQDLVFDLENELSFTYNAPLSFDNVIYNNGTLNEAGTVFTAETEQTLVFTFKMRYQISAQAVKLQIFKNNEVIDEHMIPNGQDFSKSVQIGLQIGDQISWKLKIYAVFWGSTYVIRGTFYKNATLSVRDPQIISIIRDAAVNRYPDVNYAVFPIENPYTFDKWPDDFYTLDNESIKYLYSEIFKVINYWVDDDFPAALIYEEDDIAYAAGNLFVPFPYIAFIVSRIAFYFGYSISNNVFEDELKYAVLVNHYIENTFLNDNPKMLKPNQVFDLKNHVPDWSVYDFLEHLCKMFGLGYEVDNNFSTIEFTFVDDLIKTAQVIDISHLVSSKPKVDNSSRINAYALRQNLPSEEKLTDRLQPLKDVNYKGRVASLLGLPENPEVKDCYFVENFGSGYDYSEAYYVYNYNPDSYLFEWLFYSLHFEHEIVSGENATEVKSDLYATYGITKADKLALPRVWSIPAAHQVAHFESAPEGFSGQLETIGTMVPRNAKRQ